MARYKKKARGSTRWLRLPGFGQSPSRPGDPKGNPAIVIILIMIIVIVGIIIIIIVIIIIIIIIIIMIIILSP